MTLTMQLPPEVEAGLLSHAKAKGVDVSDFVQNLVLERISAKTDTVEVFRPAAELSADERIRHLHELVKSHAGNAVVLTDGDMGLESIYEDRGL